MSKFPVLLGAIEIIASENDGISITETGSGTNTATIAAGTYYLRGDGASGDFCAALKTALEAASASTNTYGVTITTDGTTVSWDTNPANVSAKVRIARLTGSDTFKINWLHANTTFDETLLGFVAEKSSADANPELSTKSPSSVWVSNEYHVDLTPGSEWMQESSIMRSGSTSVVRRSDKASANILSLQWVDGRRVNASENTSDEAATLEEFIDNNNDGRPVEIHEQSLASSSATTLSALSAASTRRGSQWVLASGGGDSLLPARNTLGLSRWDFSIELKGA